MTTITGGPEKVKSFVHFDRLIIIFAQYMCNAIIDRVICAKLLKMTQKERKLRNTCPMSRFDREKVKSCRIFKVLRRVRRV